MLEVFSFLPEVGDENCSRKSVTERLNEVVLSFSDAGIAITITCAMVASAVSVAPTAAASVLFDNGVLVVVPDGSGVLMTAPPIGVPRQIP